MAELHALTALRNAETIVSRRRQICRENLVLLGRFFDEYQELFEWVSPRSGCVGYPRFKSELRVEELTRQLAEGPGVLIMPASVFAHSGNFFRIGFGRTTMPAALQRFTEFVDANRKTW
jgi:aspartate/methionine/tyrosine aminotransferase